MWSCYRLVVASRAACRPDPRPRHVAASCTYRPRACTQELFILRLGPVAWTGLLGTASDCMRSGACPRAQKWR
jgi:hypothetical protein